MVWERGLGEGLRVKKKRRCRAVHSHPSQGYTLFFPSSVVQRKVVFVLFCYSFIPQKIFLSVYCDVDSITGARGGYICEQNKVLA